MNNNILVIGDPIIDINVNLINIGENPENKKIPKCRSENNTFSLGGAANAALILKQLGAENVYFLAPYGRNPDFLNALTSEEINILLDFPDLLVNQISVKTRFYLEGKYFLRTDSDVFNEIPESVLHESLNDIENIDSILVSDYGKGCISKYTVSLLRDKFPNALIVVDPKGKDFEKYNKCDFITPNKKEYKDLKLKNNFDAKKIILTNSEKGINYLNWNSPATNKNPECVCGAGDIVAATIARFMPKNPTIDGIKHVIDLSNQIVGKAISYKEKAQVKMEDFIDA